MMGYSNIRSAEELLQEAWDEAEGELTFDTILRVILDYHAQFDPEDVEGNLIGEIEDPFDEPNYD